MKKLLLSLAVGLTALLPFKSPAPTFNNYYTTNANPDISASGTNVINNLAVTRPQPQDVGAFASSKWSFDRQLFNKTGDDADVLRTSAILRRDGKLFVYYGKVDALGTTTFTVWGRVGRDWDSLVAVGEVFGQGTGGAWDDGWTSGFRFLKEQIGGTNYVFYIAGDTPGTSETPSNVGLAWTTNGTNFTRYAGNPVISLGANTTWNDTYNYRPFPIYAFGKYFLFINAASAPSKETIGFYTAPSITGPWTQNPGNPCVSNFEGVGGDAVNIVADPVIERMEDGTFLMLVHALNTSVNATPHLQAYWSRNLTNWVTVGNVTMANNAAAYVQSPELFWDDGLKMLFDDSASFNLARLALNTYQPDVRAITSDASITLVTNANAGQVTAQISSTTTNFFRNAGNLNAGTVPTARLGSGTANNTTFLRGDQTWATPAGGSGGTNTFYGTDANHFVTLGNGSDTATVYATPDNGSTKPFTLDVSGNVKMQNQIVTGSSQFTGLAGTGARLLAIGDDEVVEVTTAPAANQSVRRDGAGTGWANYIPLSTDAAASAISATAALNYGSILAAASADLTITVTGAAVGDAVILGPPAAPDANITYTAFVSSANTVTVRSHNVGAISVDQASATFRATVIHY